MINFEEAYRSLDNAKREEETLKAKESRLKSIYRTIKRCCRDCGFLEYLSIPEQVRVLERDNKDQRLNILIAFFIYTFGFAVVDFISVLIFANPGIILTSIVMGLLYFIGHSSKFIVRIIKNNQKIKILDEIEESLSDDSKYKDQTLQQLMSLISGDKESLKANIDYMSAAIQEYETALNDANRELAEEVLASSGIEASVKLNSSMKVLAKRYEEQKRLER